MRFLSTLGHGPAVTFETALFEGLAPDSGLYMPERVDPLPASYFDVRSGVSLVETALPIARAFVEDEVSAPELESLLRDALDFPIPLVHLSDDIWMLELFHGPTLAFKDVGARVMARLMAYFYRGPGASSGESRAPGETPRDLTVLVATSGDTGSAVAHAFYGVSGTRVVVLYPDGQVSPVQEAQFTTLGGNVRAVAVAGTFDDCQRLAKEAFADERLRSRVPLTSANSINIGRLIPQIFYYFFGLAQLPRTGLPVVVSTPSGNFGNLTAGLFAKHMGLGIERFVAATNINDVVPEYLSTGRFSPRPSQHTLSNAMDVGNPSNFARILYLYGSRHDAICRDIEGSRHEDSEVQECIRRIAREYDYVLDPHTAVAYLGLRAALDRRKTPAVGICLATAHPAKFGEIVQPLIERKLELPERLARCLEGPKRVVRIAPRLEELNELLVS